MSSIHSFAPIEHASARVLILGSMPGEASLRAGQYYAHPQNNFWRVMEALISLNPKAGYAQKIEALKSARIAVWDVLHSCQREGSLDANIVKTSRIANDFVSFFAGHRSITHVFFNGGAAEQIYRKNVLPLLKSQHIEYLRLPSTSPANASISFERKLEAWRVLLRCDQAVCSVPDA
jgi:double-stranded uracil-DNA glycosylase